MFSSADGSQTRGVGPFIQGSLPRRLHRLNSQSGSPFSLELTEMSAPFIKPPLSFKVANEALHVCAKISGFSDGETAGLRVGRERDRLFAERDRLGIIGSANGTGFTSMGELRSVQDGGGNWGLKPNSFTAEMSKKQDA